MKNCLCGFPKFLTIQNQLKERLRRNRHQQAVAQEAPSVGAKDECGGRAMTREMEAGMGLSSRYANWSPGDRVSTFKGDSRMDRL